MKKILKYWFPIIVVAIQVAVIVLKVTGIINWSWFIIALPSFSLFGYIIGVIVKIWYEYKSPDDEDYYDHFGY